MLKRSLKAAIIPIILATACSRNEPVPNTDIDITRAFIKNTLQDNFDNARTFIFPDSLNKVYFDLFDKQYHQKNKTELDNYKNADIIINEIDNVSDSVTVINYSNSYKKNYRTVIKAVRINGKWMIDFKYTVSGNL